jgi:retinol dehydrogenase 12
MDFIRAQLTRIPRITPVNLSACTVLITGANTGLGLAASREVLMSSPKRLILAVRNLEEGNAARTELMGRGEPTEIEVRKLDQNSFESVTSFVKGLKGNPVDFVILNAGG